MGLRGSNPNRLTPRDIKFAELILQGIKPEQAAIECGLSNDKPNVARVAGYKLLNKPSIKGYLEQERLRRAEEIRKATDVDDIWITQKLKEIVETCLTKIPLVRFHPVTGAELHVRDNNGNLIYTYADSNASIKAVENLAKHIGYYELDNKQRQTVIKIGAVQNVQNFFFADEQPPEEEPPLEIGQ